MAENFTWTKDLLVDLLGEPPEAPTFEASERDGTRRRIYRWNCNGNPDAIVAAQRHGTDQFDLIITCDDAAHQELLEYPALHLDDVVFLNESMRETRTLPRDAARHTFHFSLTGPPDLREPVQLTLRIEADSPNNELAFDVGIYLGGARQFYMPMLRGHASHERKVRLFGTPAWALQLRPDTRGFLLGTWPVRVTPT